MTYIDDVSSWKARRLLSSGVLLLCATVAVYTGWTLVRANRAVEQSAIKAGSGVPVQITRLSRSATGWEHVGATAHFDDAVAWRGLLYLCGPSGLFAYQPDGQLAHSYLVGIDLPQAPLVAMRPGIGAGGADQELWIATAGEGALAFDGKAFRQIRPSHNLHRRLTSILPLSTGRVLFGTERSGVLVFDGRRLEPYRPAMEGVHVTTLEGNESDVWIGTLDRGILHTHGGQTDTISDLPDKQVMSISADSSRAWVGTAVGVAEIENGRVTRTLAPGLFAKTLYNANGTLWVGTLGGEILELRLDAGRSRPSMVSSEPVGSEIAKLLAVDEKLLALTRSSLRVARSGTMVAEAPKGALTDRNISSLSVDTLGRLWIGYFDRGLDVLEGNLKNTKHFEDDHVFCVNRIAQDTARNLTAVATANGLVLFDREPARKQVLTRKDGLIANHVSDVAITQDGGMALATTAGVSIVDSTGVRSLYAFHGLVNNHAYALGSAGGKIFVGTLGGLSMLESGMVRANFTTANSPLRHNWISAVLPFGQEWYIGTYGSGVVRIDGNGGWSSYRDFPAKLEINPNAMAASGSRVYAGSLGEGLWVLDRAEQRWRQLTEGLPSRNVTAVAVQGSTVYVGTDNGLVRIAEEKL